MSNSQESYQVEQDKSGGDALPTYDDLAARSGPNSRFGRWRGWVEKRAGERFLDLTAEERERRRDRGWGNDPEDPVTPTQSTQIQFPPTQLPPPQFTPTLHVQTDFTSPPLPDQSSNNDLPTPTPIPFTGKCLSPTHLALNHFGSRFLPHTTSPIRCLLPLLTDRLLLIGHDEGLSVLDTFPLEWTETGSISYKGPDESRAFLMWRGEGVFQMSILEAESTGEGTPHGVVLMLVGCQKSDCSPRDQEPPRTLRMYNLVSLTCLAKASVSKQGGQPVDLSRPWNTDQTVPKKHRPHASISIPKGLKSLIESPSPQRFEPLASYSSLMPTPITTGRLTPTRSDSACSIPDSTWDVVDDVPLRWATDFVPLASAGSRLNTSVLSYALWRGDNGIGKHHVSLAVMTKNNILLYEAPKGERAFHFVKEFYTPLQPRSVTFVQQAVQDVTRSLSDAGRRGHNRSNSSTTFVRREASVVQAPPISYGPQLSMFVIFDKKATCIRLADSAVTEVELYDDSNLHPRDSSSSPGSRRSRISLDGFHKDSRPLWALPSRIELPVTPSFTNRSSSRTVHVLTRGRQSHILPSPLPSNLSANPPLCVMTWETVPTYVTPRVCYTSEAEGMQPMLQLVALGEDGVEVQEISLSFLSKGKGKARVEGVLRSHADVGGASGFLCVGGHWHRPAYPDSLTRSISTASSVSATSFDSLESTDVIEKMQKEQGIYGWCRKGLEDWRIFWVGGDGSEQAKERTLP